jgi:peroxiredoxin
MVSYLLKRFGIALLLIAVGLGSILYFSKVTKTQATTVPTAHNHASSDDHKECAVRVTGRDLPPLSLRDTRNDAVAIVPMTLAQPVIVIRYLGYSCSHCIAQLLALQKLTDSLKAHNIKVLAFSDDSPSQNETVVRKYGFDPAVFTFAADPAQSSARSLGAVYRETDGMMTELHVALVVIKGRVVFAQFDTKPFADVNRLLSEAMKGAAV